VGDGTKRVERVEDYLNVGDKVEVQIAEIDARGKVYLDKVGSDGEVIAPAGGSGPGNRDRGGDRGPRDRGERDHGDRGPSRGDDRAPSGDGPAGESDEARRRRRRQR
jgi:polyribonucleotide nucleotidyltransferase